MQKTIFLLVYEASTYMPDIETCIKLVLGWLYRSCYKVEAGWYCVNTYQSGYRVLANQCYTGVDTRRIMPIHHTNAGVIYTCLILAKN